MDSDTKKDNKTVLIVKLGSRSKVYLKSLGDLDLELVAIIAMSPPTHHSPIKLFSIDEKVN